MSTKPGVPRPVWLLGWASLFTDAATEMIYPLLPVFLSRMLGASALSLGVIEGVAEGVNSVLKVASGYLSDRRVRRRPIVIGGYALSSLARPLIALTTTWPQVLMVRVLDRTGKGIRGAPRDAMLAGFATAQNRGRIFGFHRAMDHTGAIVGPLVATVILFFAPGEYRMLFALTAIPGAIAVALLFLVPEPDAPGPRVIDTPTRGTRPTYVGRVPGGEVSEPSGPAGTSRSLVAFLAVLFVFSLGNSTDAFLLLRLSEVLGGVTYIPLLWAGIHVVKASLSTWGGTLSDTFGRKQVIAIGWCLYAVVYLGFATASSPTSLVAWFLVYGAFFALTEGAEKALVADLTPSLRAGRAFGWYNATLGTGALMASVLFGFLYERFSAATAFGTGAALAAVAAVLLMWVPSGLPRRSASREGGDGKIMSSNAKNSRNQ